VGVAEKKGRRSGEIEPRRTKGLEPGPGNERGKKSPPLVKNRPVGQKEGKKSASV